MNSHRKNMGPFTKVIIGIILGVIVILAAYYRFTHNNNQPAPVANSITQNTSDNSERFDATSNTTSDNAAQDTALATPIDQFKDRVTKKYFGTYVTPQNSPVKPERFTGYHTGVDVEFSDITEDVPVYAVADGKVVLSKTASGYGGVFIVQFNFEGKTYSALYGHIRPTTLPAVGTTYTKNQIIAVLGSGFTSETDQERRHLHFSIQPGTTSDIRGYVQNQSELSDWVNPFLLYK